MPVNDEPYKGLRHYTEDDAAYFFGRTVERNLIIANLQARRLTLILGESGVGKSSLLRAGVASCLLEAARRDKLGLGAPEFVPVVFSDWRDDPVRGSSTPCGMRLGSSSLTPGRSTGSID